MEMVKKLLRNCPFAHRAIRKLYWRFHPNETRRNAAMLTERIEKALRTKESVFLVKIGAHDGRNGDPLYTMIQQQGNRWRGILVEPVGYLRNRLRDNYPDVTRFTIEGVAIGDQTTTLPFYRLKDAIDEIPGMPPYADQLGSFNRQHIIDHLGEDRAEYIVTEMVTCMTLNDLLERHAVKAFDCLHLDTEGYDWVILSQLDLSLYSPSVVIFEHNHLSEHDKECAFRYLDSSSYHLYDCGRDCLAIRY